MNGHKVVVDVLKQEPETGKWILYKLDPSQVTAIDAENMASKSNCDNSKIPKVFLKDQGDDKASMVNELDKIINKKPDANHSNSQSDSDQLPHGAGLVSAMTGERMKSFYKKHGAEEWEIPDEESKDKLQAHSVTVVGFEADRQNPG